MALITGGVIVTGTLSPTDTNDVYATHDSTYGKGGYREVADLIERNNITPARRSDGMLVYVRSENKIYKLEDGLENSNWTEFDIQASAVKFDGSASNLSSDNVQDAIEEVRNTVNNVEQTASELHTLSTKQFNYQLLGGATGFSTSTQGENVTIETVVNYAENDFSVGPTQKTATAHSFVTGTYNVSKNDSIVEVGIGSDENNKQNAFEVSSIGEVSAPSMTSDMITEDGHLTTKHYIDYLVIDCGQYDD